MKGPSHPYFLIRSVCILALPFLAFSSCSTIVGTIKPVDEKSEKYSVIDLAKEAPKVWKKLDQAQMMPKDADVGSNTDAFSSELTDVAYQSLGNAAIVSLNSSCRKGRGQVSDLRPILRELLLGMSQVDERTETETEISGVPALGGMVSGQMAGERTKIRALVVSKEDCVYDLMYIARPERFKAHEGDFNRFISSFKLR